MNQGPSAKTLRDLGRLLQLLGKDRDGLDDFAQRHRLNREQHCQLFIGWARANNHANPEQAICIARARRSADGGQS